MIARVTEYQFLSKRDQACSSGSPRELIHLFSSSRPPLRMLEALLMGPCKSIIC